MKLVLLSALLISCVLQPVLAADLVKKASVDLNGDGTKESVSLDIGKRNNGDYTLHVNKIAVKGSLWEGVDGFAVVDIDPSDKYNEIDVHTSGPSDDPANHFYWYDGKDVKDMGKIEGGASFPANGTVLVDRWASFWLMRHKYALDKKTRELKEVPQELYWVNVTCHVGTGFAIRTSRQDSTVVANLKEGTEILIVACDPSPTKCEECKPRKGEGADYCDWPCDWYLVKSSTGLMGWVRTVTLLDHVHDLPLAD